MTRWFPHPVASAFVAAGWLLLSGLSVASALMAALLAFALPRFTHRFIDQPVPVRSLGAALRFTLVVLYDIVVANITVARLVLGPSARLRPGFVAVPLDATHPWTVTLLASIVTMTPGTLSATMSEDHRTLYVHALDLDDADALVDSIKTRYERPLLEIFGC